MKLTPVTIDGNIFMYSISSAILGNMSAKDIIFNGSNENPMFRGRGLILSTFFTLVLNEVNEMCKQGNEVTSVSIVWDRKKDGGYYKSKIIDQLGTEDGYKGDRKYYTAEDIAKMQAEFDAEEDIAKIKELKVILEEAKKAAVIQQERYAAINFIKENLPSFGIKSYEVPGFEADDLDYILGLETNKRGGKHIHMSGDSDWSFHINNSDLFWQFVQGKRYVKGVNEVREKFKIPADMELMTWAEIYFSAKGSHNNLIKTLNPDIKRVTDKYLQKLYKGDFSDITDKERFEAQRKCFRILDFPNVDVVQSLYNDVTSFQVKSNTTDFRGMLNTLEFGELTKNTLTKKYDTFVSTIRQNILKNIITSHD